MGWSKGGWQKENGWYTPVAVGTTWNPADKNASINLSNGNLTAALPSVSSANYLVRANNAGRSSGKYYYELHIDNIGSLLWAGIANASESTSNAVGTTSNGISHAVNGSSGNIVCEGVALVNDGVSFGNGSTLCLAVDIDNNKLWFRNGAGNWNGSGSDNPATNTGGVTMTGLNPGPYFPALSLSATGDAATANFGGSAYAQTPPAGFGNW